MTFVRGALSILFATPIGWAFLTIALVVVFAG
jgi:hypothetical protein